MMTKKSMSLVGSIKEIRFSIELTIDYGQKSSFIFSYCTRTKKTGKLKFWINFKKKSIFLQKKIFFLFKI